MRPKPISRCLLLSLIAAAVVTPIAICVLVALGQLLAAMGDAKAASVVDWITVAFGAVWTLDLILLVVVLAIHSLAESDEPPESE